jgi:type IV pilus assembly protein PilN
MRISINLATRPFVELRPLFARLRIAMAALALLAVGLYFGLNSLNARARIATAEMDSLKAKTATFEQERARNEARMRQPENQAVLERSQFLNALFTRKSFSWTAVMMDLEHVLPSGVQVTSIDPVISKEGELSIRLRVTGDRDKAIQLVRNLETSQRFTAPRLGGETALTVDKANAIGRGPAPGVRNVSSGLDQVFGNGVEFEIFSGYNPLPPTIVQAAKKVDARPKAKASDFVPSVQHQRKPATAGRPAPPPGPPIPLSGPQKPGGAK